MPRSRMGGVVAFLALALLGSVVPAVAQSTPDEATAARHFSPLRTVGYFTQWGPGQLGYVVKYVQTSGTAARHTHLNYAFGNVNAEGRCFERGVRRRRRRPAGPTPGGQLQPVAQAEEEASRSAHPDLPGRLDLVEVLSPTPR